jgi:hypothetical protein
VASPPPHKTGWTGCGEATYSIQLVSATGVKDVNGNAVVPTQLPASLQGAEVYNQFNPEDVDRYYTSFNTGMNFSKIDSNKAWCTD